MSHDTASTLIWVHFRQIIHTGICSCLVKAWSRDSSQSSVDQIKEEACSSLLVNLDKGLIMMTGKPQSHSSTSGTIRARQTLQDQAWSRMSAATCWLSTFHLQPQFKGLPGCSPSAPMTAASAVQPPPAPGAKLAPLHTTGSAPRSINNTTAHSQHAELRRYLRPNASGDVWMGFTQELSTPLPPQRGGRREATSAPLAWIPLLFPESVRGLGVIAASRSSLLD